LRETKRAQAATGVAVLDVELVRLTPDLAVAELEPFLHTAAELGARRVLTQVHDDDLSRAGGKYWELCDRAKRCGLTCDIEFLTWTGMRDLASTLAFIGAVGHANGGVCIDTLHFARSGCAPEEIDAIPPQWLHFAQVCDAPRRAPRTRDGLIEAAREDRLWPGEGGLALRQMIERLPPGMPLALEIPNRKLAMTMAPEARVRGAAEATRRLLAEMQDTENQER
jgi:sugar phosphate isomerase/epimerase